MASVKVILLAKREVEEEEKKSCRRLRHRIVRPKQLQLKDGSER